MIPMLYMIVTAFFAFVTFFYGGFNLTSIIIFLSWALFFGGIALLFAKIKKAGIAAIIVGLFLPLLTWFI